MKQMKGLKGQWGLFSFGSSKGKSSTENKQDTEREVEEKQTQLTTGTQTESQSGSSTTRQFSADIQGALEGFLLQQIGGPGTGKDGTGGSASADIKQIASFLTDRAQNADSKIAADNAAIIANARSVGQRELDVANTALATSTGSSGASNSLIAQIASQGQADLERQLAAAEGNLNLTGRSLVTDEFKTVLTALAAAPAADAQQTDVVASIASVLRGAETTTTTAQSGQSTNEQLTDIQSALDEIVKSTQSQTGSTKKSGFSFGI